uniref:prohead protease/major capsid protein fusion protein n=1 Tax=uncultured Brevundimonas sp. TaxID=213418 RepID=UPI00344B5731
APEQRAAPAPAPAPVPAPAPDANAGRMDAAAAIQFVEDARAFGSEIETQARTWATTLTADAARAQLLRAAADHQRAATPEPVHARATITRDARDTMRQAMADAVMHRHNPALELPEAAREWRGLSLLEMARYNLEANGEKVRGLTKRELAGLALRQHSTSDFPNLLSNVAGKTLRAGYEMSPQTFKAWQRRASAPDFKQISRLQLGGAPSFLLVPEGGQFKQGTIGEGKEVYSLATYGRIFNVSRQTLINDDLDAFTRIPEMWGRAASDFESDVAYAPLIANPNMGDGVALFHSTHANLAGSGAVISETTIQAAEVAMGSQVGIEGRPIRATPKWLITAVKDKVAAQKLLSAVQATQTSNVNVYQGAMTPIVEPRLNRASGATPWFIAADSAQVDTIEYAYLEGDDGVFLEERTGFEVDGIEFKARLDFASKAIDFRGLYQNPGT